MLDNITPVILTYNEENNIERVLTSLSWANEIYIIDSYSTDNTLELISNYNNVKLFKRKFDNHSSQWNYAINETGINSHWILALDADYIPTREFIDELKSLKPVLDGYHATFHYCVFGKVIRSALYPPVTVLYRREVAKYVQDGHTQRVVIDGNLGRLESPLLHDDRKPLRNWLWAQDRYMSLEAQKISDTPWWSLSMADRIRKIVGLAPILIFVYCVIVKRGMLDGKAGLYYALQRSLSELILSLKLTKHVLVKRKSTIK